MKKVLLLLLILASGQPSVFANCPTPDEYRAKLHYFQAKALQLIYDSNKSVNDAEQLSNEQDAYMNSIFPSCIKYFNTTQVPMCSKLQTLSSSYIMLPKEKQYAAKNQINAILTQQVVNKCKFEVDTLKFMMD